MQAPKTGIWEGHAEREPTPTQQGMDSERSRAESAVRSAPVAIPRRGAQSTGGRSASTSSGGSGSTGSRNFEDVMPEDLRPSSPKTAHDWPRAMSPRGPAFLAFRNTAGNDSREVPQAESNGARDTTEAAVLEIDEQIDSRPTAPSSPPPPASTLHVQQRMPPDASVHPAVAAAAAAAASSSNSPRTQPTNAGSIGLSGSLNTDLLTSARSGTPGSWDARRSPSPTPEPTSVFYGLPALSEVQNPRARRELLCRKLHLCCEIYDFMDPTKDIVDKEGKRIALIEIADALSNMKGILTDEVCAALVEMITKNLFRTLHMSPPTAPEAILAGELEEDEPTLEPAWPHLHVVYEILLRFVTSPDLDPRTARRYIDQKFLLGLLDLFDSEDPRERDYLKMILHRIYGKFMPLRPFIRRSIANVFFYFVFESERHNGIAELLEILGSIINGFALPLKEEHKNFLRKALIPLHIPRTVALYHQQLVYCMTQFVEKYPPLAVDILRGLLRYWPLTNSQKEVLFLAELEEIIEQTHPREFSIVLEDLFRRIAKCMQSPHFQVAERTLFLWNNEYLVSLILQYRERVFPIVFGALVHNERNHWNPTVTNLTCNVRKLMIEMDLPLFERCARLHERLHAQKADAERDDDGKRHPDGDNMPHMSVVNAPMAVPGSRGASKLPLTEPIPIQSTGNAAGARRRTPRTLGAPDAPETLRASCVDPGEHRSSSATGTGAHQEESWSTNGASEDPSDETLYARSSSTRERMLVKPRETTTFESYRGQAGQDFVAKMHAMDLGHEKH